MTQFCSFNFHKTSILLCSVTDETLMECLVAHNEYRAKHDDTKPLTWSNHLAQEAQKWAEKIASDGKMAHCPPSKRFGQGENIGVCYGKSLKYILMLLLIQIFPTPGGNIGHRRLIVVLWQPWLYSAGRVLEYQGPKVVGTDPKVVGTDPKVVSTDPKVVSTDTKVVFEFRISQHTPVVILFHLSL